LINLSGPAKGKTKELNDKKMRQQEKKVKTVCGDLLELCNLAYYNQY